MVVSRTASECGGSPLIYYKPLQPWQFCCHPVLDSVTVNQKILPLGSSNCLSQGEIRLQFNVLGVINFPKRFTQILGDWS